MVNEERANSLLVVVVLTLDAA
ncbi:MAG: hypothetical protein QOC74_4520, partial [Pseudonocardiales bacterium]|nr:hypothetical protein [Pseudonocardiales bacterium]